MANPLIPGIPQAEQDLLYVKLNTYNEGRASYKEAGAYLVVLPRPERPLYTLWIYSPLPERQSVFFISDLSANVHEALRMASTLCFYSPRRLFLVDYNAKRMQSKGDDLVFFGKYRGHFLHEILRIDPGLPLVDSLQVRTQNTQTGTLRTDCQNLPFRPSGYPAEESAANKRQPLLRERG